MLGRWIRRNPGVSGLLLCVVLLLVGGSVVSTWFGLDAREQAKEAQEARRESERRLVDTLALAGRAAEASGDLSAAALWFAVAAQQAADDPDRAAGLRTTWLSFAATNPTPWRAVHKPGGEPTRLVRLHRSGRWLIGGADKRPWQLWDMAAEQLTAWPGPERTVTAAAWSIDGRLLATGGGRGDVQLWEVDATGGPPRAWRAAAHPPSPQIGAVPNPVRYLTFDLTGRRLAVVSGRLRVWDVQANHFFPGELPHNAPVIAVAFSPRGDRLATVDQTKALRVFSVDAPDAAPRLLFGPTPHYQRGGPASWDEPPAFLDNNRVFTASKELAALHNLATGKVVKQWPAGPTPGVTVFASPAGESFVIRRETVEPELWHGLSGAPEGPPRGRLALARPLAAAVVFRFSADGKSFLAGRSREFELWQRSGAPLSSALSAEGFGACCDCSADGRWFAVAWRDGLIQLWKARQGPPLLTRLSIADAPGFCFIRSADNARVVAVDAHDGRWRLRAHDTKTGRAVGAEFTEADKPFGGAVSPDYRTAFILTPEGGGRLSAWDLASGRPAFAAQELPAAPMVMECSPDGRRIVLVCRNGEMQLRDAASGAIVRRHDLGAFGSPTYPPDRIRFSHDGRWFVTFGFKEGVRLWAASDGAAVRTLAAAHAVREARFSPDDQWLLTSGGFKGRTAASVWELASGRAAGDPLPLPDRVFCARFDPTGERIALARRDNRVSIWDWRAEAGTPMVLPHPKKQVPGVAWSPDSRWLATAAEGVVRIWDGRTGRPLTPEWSLLDPGQRRGRSPSGRVHQRRPHPGGGLPGPARLAVQPVVAVRTSRARPGRRGFGAAGRDQRRTASPAGGQRRTTERRGVVAALAVLPRTTPDVAWVSAREPPCDPCTRRQGLPLP